MKGWRGFVRTESLLFLVFGAIALFGLRGSAFEDPGLIAAEHLGRMRRWRAVMRPSFRPTLECL